MKMHIPERSKECPETKEGKLLARNDSGINKLDSIQRT